MLLILGEREMDNASKKIVVETVDNNGKKLKLYIKPIGHSVLQDAQMVYSVKLTSLIKQSTVDGNELFSRQQLEQHLDTMGLWTEADSRRFLELQIELRDMELQLKSGGIRISQAKQIAVSMKTKRAILLVLYNKRAQFDGITMESIAENKKFNFLLFRCVMNDDDKPFFTSIDDYESRQSEQSSVDVASAMATKLYGYSSNVESNLIENQWLKQFEFADDKGRLIDTEKRLIDVDGQLINGEGRLVDKDGNLVDNKGRPVDEQGEFVVETKPFLDDITGKPLKSTKGKRKKKTKVG